jgi:importin subunit beta-1
VSFGFFIQTRKAITDFPFSDLADAFPNGQFAELYSADWIVAFVREVRANREFGPRTIETARWAREQVRRQLNIVAPNQNITA